MRVMKSDSLSQHCGHELCRNIFFSAATVARGILLDHPGNLFPPVWGFKAAIVETVSQLWGRCPVGNYYPGVGESPW